MTKTLCSLIFVLGSCSSCIAIAQTSETLPAQLKADSALVNHNWHHGAENCDLNQAAEFEVFSYSETSYILRQNKCSSFEAPFVYVLFGRDKVLVLDTGATEAGVDAPLYRQVHQLIETQSSTESQKSRPILVWHSHGHRDHYQGDDQFVDKQQVTVVGTQAAQVNAYFGFSPNQATSQIDLGDRLLTIMATPGHQEEAIAVYDPQTQWLLTGDTLYPGYIYVKDWQDYKGSIARLSEFSQSHDVSAILGAHIEMHKSGGGYYSFGTEYQPNEASLVLAVNDLHALNDKLANTQEAEEIASERFIIAPMGMFQKTVSNIARWLTQ